MFLGILGPYLLLCSPRKNSITWYLERQVHWKSIDSVCIKCPVLCFPFYVLIICALLMMLVTFKKVFDTLYEANHVDLVSFPSQLGADDCSANSEAAVMHFKNVLTHSQLCHRICTCSFRVSTNSNGFSFSSLFLVCASTCANVHVISGLSKHRSVKNNRKILHHPTIKIQSQLYYVLC